MDDERLSASWALSALILGSEIAYTALITAYQARKDDAERAVKIREWMMGPRRSALVGRTVTGSMRSYRTG